MGRGVNRIWTFGCAGLCLVGILALGGLVAPVATSYLRPYGPIGVTPISDATSRFDRTPLKTELAAAGFDLGDRVHLRLYKRERLLEVWVAGPGGKFELFKSFPIEKFSGDLGPKLAEGDRQAPEGFYKVTARQLNPQSRHHLAFNLGFPNALDQQLGRTGSLIMVHGGMSSAGCYALGDAPVDQIYALVEAALARGQGEVDVAVFPFRLTAEALAAEAGSPWVAFWENLKEGAEIFDRDRLPPRVGAKNGVYRFGDSVFEPGSVPIAGWV